MGLGRAGVGVAWCEESWDGRECVGRKEHIKERRCVEKGGDNGGWECMGDPGPGQGKWGRGVCGAEERWGVGLGVGVSHAGTGTQSK